jgi:uncharacterized protein RhaS with RHS repeats
MQQRYYDPIAGRFLSVDPVTTDAKTGSHFNRYVYADNNPYRFKDPDGRSPKLLLDFALNVAANVVETGELGLASAAGETLAGALNPAKTVQSAVRLATAVKRTGAAAFKNKVWKNNAAKNDGAAKCEKCGTDVEPGKKLEKGDTVSPTRGDADHKTPLADGGANNADTNGQLLCNPCHVDKTTAENSARLEKKEP